MFKELNVMSIFFESPKKEFSVRDVARVSGITPATASKQLKLFLGQGILKHRKLKVSDLYSANIDNEYYRDIKIFYNIRKLKESGIIDSMDRFYAKPAIVLFGSAANGMDTETSDIDLLVVSEKTAEFPESDQFKKKLGRELHIFPVRKIQDLKNMHLINNILNGIVIRGEIEWK